MACAVVAATGGCAALVGVSPGRAAAGTPPRSQLTRIACHSTLDPARRTVSVVSVMRPVPGTRRLSVMLTLLAQRPGSARAQSVGRIGGLGVWVSPADPTLGRRPGDVWKLAKAVYDVDAPARYRFRVAFRWQGAHGRVLATATRQTGRCAERELRPDLLVKTVTVSSIAHHPRRERYVAVIANHGATASGPFQVSFTPGSGGRSQTRSVGSLAAGAIGREPFTGPACDAASPPIVVADPANRVNDFNRSNNALTVACPVASAASAASASAAR